MLAVVGAISHGRSLEVRFTATIEPLAKAEAETTDLGDGLVMVAVTYTEAHMPDGNRNERIETLAYKDDGIEFSASEHLAVRRWRRDGWPQEVIARR